VNQGANSGEVTFKLKAEKGVDMRQGSVKEEHSTLRGPPIARL